MTNLETKNPNEVSFVRNDFVDDGNLHQNDRKIDKLLWSNRKPSCRIRPITRTEGYNPDFLNEFYLNIKARSKEYLWKEKPLPVRLYTYALNVKNGIQMGVYRICQNLGKATVFPLNLVRSMKSMSLTSYLWKA